MPQLLFLEPGSWIASPRLRQLAGAGLDPLPQSPELRSRSSPNAKRKLRRIQPCLGLCKSCDTSSGHVSQGLLPGKSCPGCRPLAQIHDSSRACLSNATTRPAFGSKSRCSQNWWRLLPLEPAKFTRVVVGSSGGCFADRAEKVFALSVRGLRHRNIRLQQRRRDLGDWCH